MTMFCIVCGHQVRRSRRLDICASVSRGSDKVPPWLLCTAVLPLRLDWPLLDEDHVHRLCDGCSRSLLWSTLSFEFVPHLFYVGDRIRRNGWPRLGVNRFLTWSSYRSTTTAQPPQTASVTVANTAAAWQPDWRRPAPSHRRCPTLSGSRQPRPAASTTDAVPPSRQPRPATTTLRTNLASHQHHPQDNRGQPPASPAVTPSLRQTTSTTDAVWSSGQRPVRWVQPLHAVRPSCCLQSSGNPAWVRHQPSPASSGACPVSASLHWHY